jgi:hypothetical protein
VIRWWSIGEGQHRQILLAAGDVDDPAGGVEIEAPPEEPAAGALGDDQSFEFGTDPRQVSDFDQVSPSPVRVEI